MFWVALATAIMIMSGDGDDTRAIRDLFLALREQIPLVVKQPEKRDAALRGIDLLEETFNTHRTRLNEYATCIEKADQKYNAATADYTRCEEGLEQEAHRLADSLTAASEILTASISEADNQKIEAAMSPETKNPKALAQKKPPPPPRPRGLEGAETSRHLTIPRNVVNLLYGPLHPQTFGQRYANETVDAGTTYQHRNFTGGDGSLDLDEWYTRFGVAFGLFDDFEAGALFIPLELSPKFRWDRVLVYLTQQFRQKHFDLALRLSFETPGNTGWSLNPGGLLRWPVGITRLDAGVFVPMDVGGFRFPKPMVVGLNVPLRETIQLTPNWFLTVESGFVRTSFAAGQNAAIPLGLGAGYTFLAGKRLFDVTGLFQWDDFLLPAGKGGVDVFQPTSYRAVLGISTQMQAL